jgi:DNA-binding LacI/PurR family transcriptional regulator/ABC-type glycerol-3-phosphate transport system substrate-binding protein
MVNPETRSRVLAIAEAMGYRPNRAARALITGRTHNLGLIVADIANPFFPPLIKASESYARQRDYHLFVADTDEDPLVEEELVQAIARQVDGVLLCSPRMGNGLIDQLGRDVPLVVINRVVAGLPAVVMDVGQGARTAITHLAGLGHERIVLLSGPRGSWTNREIRRAATATARSCGVTLTVHGPNQPTEHAGAAAASHVQRCGASAVLAYNDLMAIGLIDGLLRLGMRVPQDVSVVGVDDIPLSRLVRPRLTTVATPTAAAGRAAVDMLLQHGADRRTNAKVTLATTLVVRDSTGPAPRPRRVASDTVRRGRAGHTTSQGVILMPSMPPQPVDPPSVPRRRAGAGPTRRNVLTVLGVGVPIALAGCGGSSGSGSTKPKAEETGPVELSVFWWGAQARADITDKVLKLYTQKHPNVTFKQQWQGNAGYYDKLATMAAGGTAPDIFQIDDNGLTEYTTRGICLDLKPFMGGEIKVDKFPASLKNSGVVKGRVGGIAAAENTPAMFYDKTAVSQLGLPEPTVGMSWQQLVDFGAQVFDASGGKLYGTMDPSADYKALEVWLRQQGKDLYSADGTFGFAADDLTGWFSFWSDAAGRKATPPADLIHNANGGDVAKQLVETKKGATSFLWSNQLSALQQGTDHQLGLVTYPGDPKGEWARAAMYWSGYSGTKHATTVASVINFLVNDPDAGKILGAERGLAPNLDVRNAVAPTLKSTDQTSVTFETGLASKFGPTPPVPPKGHSQVKTLLVTAAESVQYKKATPSAAASTFLTQARAAIAA